MKSISKKDLLEILEHIKSCYLIGCFSGYILSEKISLKDLKDELKITNVQRPNDFQKINITQIKPYFVTKEGKEFIVTEYTKTILRSFIRDTFELVKVYAEKTNQDDKIKKESWYNFARILRNCVSHNHEFDFKYEKKILPVKWRDKEIKAEMDGKVVDFSIINFSSALELFDDIKQFVESKLH